MALHAVLLKPPDWCYSFTATTSITCTT